MNRDKIKEYISQNKIYGNESKIPIELILTNQISTILRLFSAGSKAEVCYAIDALESFIVENFFSKDLYFRENVRIFKDCDKCKDYNKCRKVELDTGRILACKVKMEDYIMDSSMQPNRRLYLAFRKFRLLNKHMIMNKLFPTRHVIEDVVYGGLEDSAESEEKDSSGDKA